MFGDVVEADTSLVGGLAIEDDKAIAMGLPGKDVEGRVLESAVISTLQVLGVEDLNGDRRLGCTEDEVLVADRLLLRGSSSGTGRGTGGTFLTLLLLDELVVLDLDGKVLSFVLPDQVALQQKDKPNQKKVRIKKETERRRKGGREKTDVDDAGEDLLTDESASRDVDDKDAGGLLGAFLDPVSKVVGRRRPGDGANAGDLDGKGLKGVTADDDELVVEDAGKVSLVVAPREDGPRSVDGLAFLSARKAREVLEPVGSDVPDGDSLVVLGLLGGGGPSDKERILGREGDLLDSVATVLLLDPTLTLHHDRSLLVQRDEVSSFRRPDVRISSLFFFFFCNHNNPQTKKQEQGWCCMMYALWCPSRTIRKASLVV